MALNTYNLDLKRVKEFQDYWDSVAPFLESNKGDNKNQSSQLSDISTIKLNLIK